VAAGRTTGWVRYSDAAGVIRNKKLVVIVVP
jgi:hypothetical protein